MIKLKPILDVSEGILMSICVVLFIAMFVLGVMAVTSRYVFESALSFPDELIRYFFVWSIALSSAVGIRRNIHAAIGLLVGALPIPLRRAVLLLSSICTAAFFLILITKGYSATVMSSAQVTPILEVSMAWVYAAIPTGALFGLLYTTELLVSQFVCPASELLADDH